MLPDLTRCAWLLAIACAVGAAAHADPAADTPRSHAVAAPAGCPAEARVRVGLGGDVMFGRWLAPRTTARASDEAAAARADRFRPHDEGPLAYHPAAALREADVAIINLETALCEPEAARRARDQVRGRHRFAAPPARAGWLAAAGVDVAVIANNHALDCGPSSIAQTRAHLANAGIAVAGVAGAADEPVQQPSRVRTRADATVAVLAFTFHPPPVAARAHPRPDVVGGGELAPALAAVRRARERAPSDILVVSLHWGVELAQAPSAAQRLAAGRLIDAGADVVFGHGSHVLGAVERHGDGLIAYDLGNLHFDMAQPITADRAVLHVDLACDGARWRVVDSDLRAPRPR